MLYYSIVVTTMGTSIQSTDVMCTNVHQYQSVQQNHTCNMILPTMNYVLLLE